MANVKGSALASRIRWVQLQHGDRGMQRIRDEASPGLAVTLEAGILKPAWYPFEQYVELNLAIDRVFGNGDLSLVKELGRYVAGANLTTIYRLFYRVGSVSWILGRAMRLYSAHFDSGHCEVATRGPQSAIMRLLAFATPHRVHCLGLQGWCERSVELSGGKQAVALELYCRTRGDDRCQFDVTWE